MGGSGRIRLAEATSSIYATCMRGQQVELGRIMGKLLPICVHIRQPARLDNAPFRLTVLHCRHLYMDPLHGRAPFG